MEISREELARCLIRAAWDLQEGTAESGLMSYKLLPSGEFEVMCYLDYTSPEGRKAPTIMKETRAQEPAPKEKPKPRKVIPY